MPAQLLSVALVSAYLKQLLESDDLLGDCWIEGEISEYFQSAQGHVYFTLAEGNVTLRCVMFRGNATRQRTRIQSGDAVVVHGRMSIYEQQGRYQLYADAVQPAGLGLQALQFELLRQKLEADGLFDESRKRPLPKMPKRIGVVTSVDGAVWHDIQQVLKRRYPLAELILSPATVQGASAPASLLAALQRFSGENAVDVIILGRGGGSTDDLAAFNDESLVRAVFASAVPVISAVGHETDWTLVDLVADLRAPTPSAAAELVSPSILQLAEDVEQLQAQLEEAASLAITDHLRHLSELTRRLKWHSPASTLASAQSDLGRIRNQLGALMSASLREHHQVRLSLSTRQRSAISTWQQDLGWKIALNRAQVSALDPHAVLRRGFAILSDAAGDRAFSSASDLEEGATALVTLSNGSVSVSINSINSSSASREIASS